MSERAEVLMRIIIGIVSGIILYAWMYLIGVFIIINFIWTIIAGKRIRDVAELCEVWNTQQYRFVGYMSFLTNERPFPFSRLAPSVSEYRDASSARNNRKR